MTDCYVFLPLRMEKIEFTKRNLIRNMKSAHEPFNQQSELNH